jgi:hypothetical protein
MKRSRNIIMGVVGLVVLIGLALAASMLVVSNEYPTRQTAEVTFSLADDFTEVRKILVRTGATKQIIIMAGDNEFLEEQWTSLGGGLDSLKIWDPGWRLEMNGLLKLRSRDEYIGRPEVLLTQAVKVTPDEVLSDVDLKEGSERLLDYEMITHFLRDEKQKNTRVELRLTQEILTTAPWFARGIADRRVHASAMRALQNQKRAILKLIADNRGKGWLLLGR